MRKYILSIASALMIAGSVIGAGEIVANLTFKVTKGNLDITRVSAGSYTLVEANPNVAGFTQIISTNYAPTLITLGDVATNGVAWFKNLDTNTNYYVELGVTNSAGVFLPFVRLNANEAWPMRLAKGINPQARAVCTGTVSQVVIEKLIFDN